MSDAREALVALILERFRAAETYMDLPRQARLLADAIQSAGWTPPGERVKPSVEDVARALFERAVKAGDAIPHRSVFEADARAVLALFPGRTEVEVKAEALREAAGAFTNADVLTTEEQKEFAAWLHVRANTIEKEADRG